MKKFCHALVCTASCLLLFAVCPVASVADDGPKINIVTTSFPPFDFSREIAGNDANVHMLLKPGAESHSYEPAPQDIRRLETCDFFIYTGGENDAWIKKILKSLTGKKPRTLRLMDCVALVAEEVVEGMEAEKEHAGENDKEMDEHVWTSPQNAMAIVRRIGTTLAEISPNKANVFHQRGEAYVAKLSQLHEDYTSMVQAAKRKTVIFGDRFPFRYLADAYGLRYYAAFSGCSTETEASAATIAFLIKTVQRENLPCVFSIELSSGKIADTVCEATGAQKLLLHSCHNVSHDDMRAGATYLSLMRKNLASLRKALN